MTFGAKWICKTVITYKGVMLSFLVALFGYFQRFRCTDFLMGFDSARGFGKSQGKGPGDIIRRVNLSFVYTNYIIIKVNVVKSRI